MRGREAAAPDGERHCTGGLFGAERLTAPRTPAEPRGKAAGALRGETVGAAVRTRAGVKPVYVSVGHRFDLSSACALALALAPRFRIVEPIRAAHTLVGSR